MREDLIRKISAVSSKSELSDEDVKTLGGYLEDLQNMPKELSELTDIFPALTAYRERHSVATLHKLCTEVVEFVQALIASTRNSDERKIIQAALRKVTQ